MAEAIRNLQLFRNGNIIVGSVETVKQTVEGMFAQGTLVLRDGEPISVRYRLTNNSEIKGLIGVAHVDSNNGSNNKILWTEGGTVSIVTHPTTDDYVTLNYTYDPATNEYDLVADANVLNLDEACVCYYTITAIQENVGRLFAEVRYTDEQGYHEELRAFEVGDSIRCSYVKSWFVGDVNNHTPAVMGVHFRADETYADGLASACDIKGRLYYYDVVSNSQAITISSQVTTNSDGFNVTTFTIDLDDSGLSSYTIGTTTTTNGYLKTYALFKDGNMVANSTIDIPKDFLVKSASVIEVVEYNGQYYNATDTQHTTALTGVSAAGAYIDFVINVKEGTPAVDEHIYVPLDSLADVYTAGNGIAISTTNIVSAKLSADSGNMISISQTDGGLFVPAGDTIVDVANIDVDCEPEDARDFYFGYYNGRYVQILPVGTNPETYTYNGQPYTGPVGGPVPCGHRYLVVRTSGGHMYMTNNDTSSDIHVSNFAIATDTNNNEVLRITMNDNTTYDVLISDINPDIPAATVNWNTANDSMSIGTEGVFTQLALGTIEAYIDNFDCGTFTIS